MAYTQEDLTYVQNALTSTPSKHVQMLAQLVQQGATHEALFRYGMQYLPQIRDKTTGKVDLNLLDGYAPQVVGFFHALSELPSLPKRLQDLATDFAAYADGETVQQDECYFKLDPETELNAVLAEVNVR